MLYFILYHLQFIIYLFRISCIFFKIKGEIRNYDDEYDSLEHDDEDHKMSHKKQSHYEGNKSI